ncbi:cache domain-containing protein, partial [Roseomonas sp. 18066]|uniref:cache domain-containing protein n=1 Tax=Roseomonas sp. 18066 TaxID=2681412 RepID=UPI00135AB759
PHPRPLPRRCCLLLPGLLPAALAMGSAPAALAQEEGILRKRAETESFLRQAAAYLEQVGIEQALAAFNAPQGRFVAGERYVFCYRLDGTVLAHGGNPALLGRNLGALRDARGKPFAATLIRIAVTQGEGWLTYDWINPVSRQTEIKDTFIMRLREDLICSAGHYRG